MQQNTTIKIKVAVKTDQISSTYYYYYYYYYNKTSDVVYMAARTRAPAHRTRTPQMFTYTQPRTEARWLTTPKALLRQAVS